MSNCIFQPCPPSLLCEFCKHACFTTCVLNCLQSSVQQFSSRAAVCLWQHSIYIPLYHITNNYFQQRLTSLARIAYICSMGKYFNRVYVPSIPECLGRWVILRTLFLEVHDEMHKFCFQYEICPKDKYFSWQISGTFKSVATYATLWQSMPVLQVAAERSV